MYLYINSKGEVVSFAMQDILNCPDTETIEYNGELPNPVYYYIYDKNTNNFIEHPDIDSIKEQEQKEAEEQEKIQKKKNIRSKIRQSAGDTDSILGTTSNNVQILMEAFSVLIVGISEAATLADIKEKIEPFTTICKDFLERIEKKEVLLPYKLNQFEEVIDEIGERATCVYKVLSESKDS